MIRLNCTNCKATLTMDDAFAGGVCRCQHCGTIQTVPKNAPGGGYGGPEPKPAKALFQKKVRSDGAGISSGTGLDQLAEAVASSGLGGSGLASGRMRARMTEESPPAAEVNPAAAQQRRLMLLLGAGLGVVILLLAIVIFLMLRGNNTAPATNAPGTNSPGSTPANDYATATPTVTPPVSNNARPVPRTSATPQRVPQIPPVRPAPDIVAPGPALTPPHAGQQTFCGVALEGPTVIFLLDRGQASGETFDLMRVACARSLESLKPAQKFQVIFWNNSSTPVAFPEDGPAPATPQSIQKLRDTLDNIVAFGKSDVMPPLAKALASNPSTIVIVTGKLVDDDFAPAVLGAHKGAATKISTVLLGQKELSAPLKQIADKTGGQYKTVSEEQLQDFTQ